MYDIGPYVSPFGFADSQRPFVWIRSRTSPSRSASAPALRPRVLDREVAVRRLAVRRSAGRRSARVADVDHVRVAPTLSPTWKPPRKTVAAASSQTGQSGRDVGGGRSRDADPDRAARAGRRGRGRPQDTLLKTRPWLKYQSETENESSTSRSRFRSAAPAAQVGEADEEHGAEARARRRSC